MRRRRGRREWGLVHAEWSITKGAIWFHQNTCVHHCGIRDYSAECWCLHLRDRIISSPRPLLNESSSPPPWPSGAFLLYFPLPTSPTPARSVQALTDPAPFSKLALPCSVTKHYCRQCYARVKISSDKKQRLSRWLCVYLTLLVKAFTFVL